jgi:hypothetical protein
MVAESFADGIRLCYGLSGKITIPAGMNIAEARPGNLIPGHDNLLDNRSIEVNLL